MFPVFTRVLGEEGEGYNLLTEVKCIMKDYKGAVQKCFM